MDQHVVYFNNCRNRDHVALFGSGAFFDLGTTGRQGAQARNLCPGQPCVVAEWSPEKQIVLNWYSFSYEALLTDERDLPDRVFFGRLFASETLSKAGAAASRRYVPLFRSSGHLKIGSVFHAELPSELIPFDFVVGSSENGGESSVAQSGAGFGDSAENRLVEAAAIRAVRKNYESESWSVRSVERDKCGFDLECSKGQIVEHVEVKGIRGTALCFIITAGEVKQAREDPLFSLVIVTSALSASPKLSKFSGAEFGKRFGISAIQYRAVLMP